MIDISDEVAGLLVRTENGFITIACNGIQYADNNDQSKDWGFMFSENEVDLYNVIMQSIIEGSIKGGIESVSGWEEWFHGKGYIYEKIFRVKNWLLWQMGKRLRMM